MTLVFAPLPATDIPAAAALWHEGWHVGHAAIVPPDLTRLRTVESFQDRLTRDLANTIATYDNGTVIGFTILHDNEVYQFYVAGQARGSGTASLQVAEIETRLRASGHTRAWLSCTVGNDRAARFYEKSGWQRVATEDQSFETSAGPFPLTVWRYEKDL